MCAFVMVKGSRLGSLRRAFIGNLQMFFSSIVAASVVHSVVIDGVMYRSVMYRSTPSLAYLMERCKSLKVLTLKESKMDEITVLLGAYSRPGLRLNWKAVQSRVWSKVLW
jgi:hypothetical protein